MQVVLRMNVDLVFFISRFCYFNFPILIRYLYLTAYMCKHAVESYNFELFKIVEFVVFRFYKHFMTVSSYNRDKI